MSMLVVGSLAFDTIETPHGRKEDVLGGSATHFSYSASYLTDVALVGVVGKDFPEEHIKLYESKGIDTSGVERSSGDTFNWTGRYVGDMNEAETLEVNLNVLANFEPKLSDAHLQRKWVFLANGDPVTQLSVANQMKKATFIVADTMNLWIATKKHDLEKLFKTINGVVMNDGEARMFTGEETIVAAARKMLSFGLDLIIIKKGEHGALAMTPDYTVVLPAYPTERVIDPTGAGDAFAGGTFGYLALCDELSPGTLRKALRYGTIC
ncbi:MAG: sugar kinase, partial [Planctomycetes bacterium]|nr:sugar kinase [Planctomycetota bacterium]